MIAAEPGAAEVIAKNLAARCPNWEFDVAASAAQLFDLAGTRPDVVLVSRFLPGAPAEELLDGLVARFPASKVVLMTGVLDEQARVYLRMAEKRGITDAVTGRLPGDRPRTLFAVLAEVEAGEAGGWEAGLPAAPGAVPQAGALPAGRPAAAQPTGKAPPGRAAALPAAGRGAAAPAAAADTGFPGAGLLRGRAAVPRVPAGRGGAPLSSHAPAAVSRGKLVLAAANKGGSGKTTVALGLALALSRIGLKVCACDLDFGGPNVAAFFRLKLKKGIEVLEGKRDVERYLPELVAPVNSNLSVLPGPANNSLPHIEAQQMERAVWRLLADHDVVVGDTPPEFWTEAKTWLKGVFPMADLVLAVVNQSLFDEEEVRKYMPKLVLMGVDPSKVRIVVNKFSSRLLPPKKIEAVFSEGLRVKKGASPRVVASIPEGWEDFVKGGYRADIPGVGDPNSPWGVLARCVAEELGLGGGRAPAGGGGRPGGGLFGIFKKLKR